MSVHYRLLEGLTSCFLSVKFSAGTLDPGFTTVLSMTTFFIEQGTCCGNRLIFRSSCFRRNIETRVEVWENEKSSWEYKREGRVFSCHFGFISSYGLLMPIFLIQVPYIIRPDVHIRLTHLSLQEMSLHWGANDD